ncbi:response regulator transcription factor [Ignavibacterium sp.]|jgi:RNA polymerase sigma factor (sigma-70 family)|uniref:response regulator n=1 Tax=Ignavibacterium sp. TaxID=2651167 RepID=UPI0025BA3810|nr:response regulator transcription factor [Ignavibacterium sp.]
MSEKIRVSIVEDEPEIREGIEDVLQKSQFFICVGSYSSAEGLLENIYEVEPDIILMDIGLKGISGIQALKQIKKMNIETAVVMLTVFEDDEKIFNSILEGADGYILKKTPPQKLVELLYELHCGGIAINPQIARKVLEMFRAKPDKQIDDLSEREREVLNLIIKGYTHKQVAEILFISPETVRGHLKNIYRKLHVHSKTEAVAKVLHLNPFHNK